jgi:hypothetical protein
MEKADAAPAAPADEPRGPRRDRLLLVFADGVGLGAEEPTNPFVSEPTPALSALLDGPLTRARVEAPRRAAALPVVLAAVDAVLGVPGLPQSATGQTTLFTGRNAQAAIGHHVPALPGPRLRALLTAHSVVKTVAGAGLESTFANAYTADYATRLGNGEVRASATTWAVLAAGVPLRTLDDLAAGEAVPWDVTGDLFVRRAGVAVEPIAPRLAGERLAALAGRHRFTLYETFLTDLAGHGRWGITPARAIERLDGLVDGVLAARPPDLTLLLTSDHGNLEEPWHKSHTTNPVPLLAVGPAAEAFAGITRLDEVAPRIRGVLGVG